MLHPHPDLLALGIQQPWAELILQAVKTIEIRSVTTRVRGPIYLYASKQMSPLPVQSDLETAIEPSRLPRGLVVGTVEIRDCVPCCRDHAAAACLPAKLLAGRYSWILGDPQRLPEPIPARYIPYGTWFYPFKRLAPASRGRRLRRGM